MLIFVSDIHLRAGGRVNISRAGQFARFWQRIETARRGAKVKLCVVGDLFDLVRDPRWLQGPARPYHEPSPALTATVERMISETLEAEKEFTGALRSRVEAGELEIHYVLGNHDRLLAHAPLARAAVRAALGMPGGDAPFDWDLRFPEYGVLAYHGHTVDQISSDPSGDAPFSDLICPELITRFPIEIRRELGIDHDHLDDIDDVRPVIAVPTWVRTLARGESKDVAAKMSKVWARLVEEFLDSAAVKGWFKKNHRRFKFDFAQKMKLMLALSARRGLKEEGKFVSLHDVLFKLLDVKFARAAAEALERKENRGLRYVVNGHTHFGSLTPLGLIHGERACYFNIGTWRTVHQLGNVVRGSPAFLAYDAMGYLVFFGPGDPLGREFEWWQGAAASA